MFRFIILLVALGLFGAWLTRPDEDRAEAMMRETVMATLVTESAEGKDAVMSAVLLGCRLEPDGCYDLLRSQLDTRYERNLFHSEFTVSGFDRRATCYGVFATFVCPGGFRKG